MGTDEPSVSEFNSPAGIAVQELSRLDRFRRSHISTWLAIALGSAMAVALVAGFFIRKPVVAILPGDAFDVGDHVVIHGAISYPSDAEVLLTTAIVRDQPSLWEYYWLKAFDNHVEFNDRTDLYSPDVTDEDVDELTRQEMTESQHVAKAVALNRLGYESFHSDAFVLQVIEGSAADGTLAPGDILLELDGEPIDDSLGLVETLRGYSPGQAVEFKLSRRVSAGSAEREEMGVSITLGEDPEELGRALVGVYPTDVLSLDGRDALDDIGFEIEFDINDVGGPSAGLALTVEILDDLTEGDLIGQAKLAFTGTMKLNGEIGRVGGLPQKAAAVKKSGAKYFIVPSDLSEEDLSTASKVLGDEVEMIQVANLTEAIDAIDMLGGDSSTLDNFERVK